MTAGAAIAHHADAHVRTFTLHRDSPGKSAWRDTTAKVHLDWTEALGRQFHLRRMQEQARHAEPELAL